MRTSLRKPTGELPASAPDKQLAEPGDVVVIEGLYKSFDGRLVLDDVHLRVPRSRIVSIIGQSGGGKTTLLRCVNLLERPDRGRIGMSGEQIFASDRIVCRDSLASASVWGWSSSVSICSHTSPRSRT
jgi:ABC-type glutathione transport system ATPase component